MSNPSPLLVIAIFLAALLCVATIWGMVWNVPFHLFGRWVVAPITTIIFALVVADLFVKHD